MILLRNGTSYICIVLLAVALCGGCSSAKISDQLDNVEQNVDVSTRPPEELAFRYAGTGNIEAMQSLLEGNPEVVNAVENSYNRTPLHIAARAGNREMVDLLLEHGADPTIEDVNGKVPADTARQEAHVDLAKYLWDLAMDTGSG